MKTLTRDWQLDLGWSLRSGAPYSVTVTQDVGYGSYTVRPDLVSDAVWKDFPTDPTKRVLNSTAFAPPPSSLSQPSLQGTLQRNTFRAPPLHQVDLAVSRAFSLHGHAMLRLRVDAINVLNVTNVGAPNSVLYNDHFGQSYQTYADALGTGTLGLGGLTPLQQVGGPRAIQFGLRFMF